MPGRRNSRSNAPSIDFLQKPGPLSESRDSHEVLLAADERGLTPMETYERKMFVLSALIRVHRRLIPLAQGANCCRATQFSTKIPLDCYWKSLDSTDRFCIVV